MEWKEKRERKNERETPKAAHTHTEDIDKGTVGCALQLGGLRVCVCAR